MSKQLVQEVLGSYVQEIGNGAGKMLRAWTPAESELAEYAAKLEAENARLTAELQEAQYMYKKLAEQADTFNEENARLREQLRKAHITTVARPFPDNDMDCEGDGSGPSCENDVMWEIQAMDASSSHYSYVCSDHLDSYQKWAEEDGRQPLVFEAD